MAALTVTAASVQASSSAKVFNGFAGSTSNIAAGDAVFRWDAETDELSNFAISGLSSGNATPLLGIALNAAAAYQPVAVVVEDPAFAHGLSGVVAGDIIIVGSTAGDLHKIADLTSGWYPKIAMVCTSSTHAVVGPITGTIAKP